MILADKIIALRKKAGWLQEELARQLDVSRQSVSKWEGAQSVPDMERVLQLSRLFGVSTDYLLKDEMECPGTAPLPDEAGALRRVTILSTAAPAGKPQSACWKRATIPAATRRAGIWWRRSAWPTGWW